MTTAQLVKTSVTVSNNSPIQDYVHPDDQTQPTFGIIIMIIIIIIIIILIILIITTIGRYFRGIVFIIAFCVVHDTTLSGAGVKLRSTIFCLWMTLKFLGNPMNRLTPLCRQFIHLPWT